MGHGIVTVRNTNAIDSEVEESPLEGDPRWEVALRASQSAQLSRASQLQSILLFIVRQAIQRPEEQVHEFDIAYRVLGRNSKFNPLDDNIVRVQMARLRKKLELYFSTEGESELLLITITLGTYRPVFTGRMPHPGTSARYPASTDSPLHDDDLDKERAPKVEQEMAVSRRTSVSGGEIAGVHVAPRSYRQILPIFVIFALAICCIALWIRGRMLERSLTPWKESPAIAALWSDFFDVRQNTDVVMEDSSFLLIQNISKQTFSVNEYVNRLYLRKLQGEDLSTENRNTLRLIAEKDLGRASAVRLAQRILTLNPLGKNLHVYNSHDYAADLINQNNIILFGNPTSNPWNELFENRLNFTEEAASDHNSNVTNHAPAPGEQAIYTPTVNNQNDVVQYCTVAYLPNHNQHGKILMVQGTTSEATEAGGNFVLSEDDLSGFLKTLHATKFPYFEVLLKISQVSGTPLTTAIVAYRTYPNLR